MFVDEMFEFLVNKPVVIKDLVRIGRSKKGEGAIEDLQRPCSLLVKLDSVWDRWLLLASKSKLKQFRVDWLFLREDLPPDVRHRRFSPRSDSGPSSFPSTSPNTVSLPCDSDSSPVDHDSARDLTS